MLTQDVCFDFARRCQKFPWNQGQKAHLRLVRSSDSNLKFERLQIWSIKFFLSDLLTNFNLPSLRKRNLGQRLRICNSLFSRFSNLGLDYMRLMWYWTRRDSNLATSSGILLCMKFGPKAAQAGLECHGYKKSIYLLSPMGSWVAASTKICKIRNLWQSLSHLRGFLDLKASKWNLWFLMKPETLGKI